MNNLLDGFRMLVVGRAEGTAANEDDDAEDIIGPGTRRCPLSRRITSIKLAAGSHD